MMIRPHTRSDFPVIAGLRWRLKTDETHGFSENYKHKFIDHYLKHLERCDRERSTVHWLLEDSEAVVGVMTVRIVQKEPSPATGSGCWGYLTNSFIVPKKRNLGLGTQLVEAVKSWAIDQGLELLIVWPSEASYPFFDEPWPDLLQPSQED